MPVSAMKKRTFERLSDVVYTTSGISLGPRKMALVSARVGKRMRQLGLDDFETYLQYLESEPSEVVGLLDAIATNVTSWFREPRHFDYIADRVGEWLEQGQTRFRIWSAACSSGEEPYSLAMVLNEVCSGSRTDVRILATDISTDVLYRAATGVYPVEKMAAVPLDLRRRWFDPVQDDPGSLQVKAALRKQIVYRRMNLSAPPFPLQGPLDAVFCRNVMIYFDDDVRRRLLHEINRVLKPGGLLFVGHAESLAGIISDFSYVEPSIYRKGDAR